MNENPASGNRPVADLSPVGAASFRKLFGSGVVGWLIGMGLLFGAAWIFSKPESVPVALLWVISHWWIAFLLGLVLLVVRGLSAKASMGRAVLAYVLPVAVLAAIAGVCLMIYPDAGLRGDLFTYLPVVLVFYGFGCLWMAGSREAGDSLAFMRAVIPSLVGGLMILGFVAVPAFASDSFTYRNAFHLTVDSTRVVDGAIVSEATLEIRKPGAYGFSAPRYVWEMVESDAGSEPQTELGEIQWGAAGAPKAESPGVFPMKIVWRKGVPTGGISQLPPYEDFVVIEVRKTDEVDKLIYCVSAPMNVK